MKLKVFIFVIIVGLWNFLKFYNYVIWLMFKVLYVDVLIIYMVKWYIYVMIYMDKDLNMFLGGNVEILIKFRFFLYKLNCLFKK